MLEKLFSRQERAKLFRTWAGAASMLLKGGNAVWGELYFLPLERASGLTAFRHAGDENGAPDDPVNGTLSTRHMCRLSSLGNYLCSVSVKSVCHA